MNHISRTRLSIACRWHSNFTSTLASLSSSYQESFHSIYLASRHDQIAPLSDGRRIGFAEWGSASGPTVFLCHGEPGSRFEGARFHALGVKYGFRVVCPDRPGIGLSTMATTTQTQKGLPRRKVVEYPRDIAELARWLGVTRYRVLGVSSGGPSALACAAVLSPRDLVSVTVVAGMCHPNQINVREAGWYITLVLWWYKHFSGLLSWYIDTFQTAKVYDDEQCRKMLEHAYTWLPEPDRRFMQHADQSLMMASLRAVFAQGARGVVEDGRTLCGPWGFELADVRGKVHLFYGARDIRTPLGFGRYYKRHLVHADVDLVEFANVGHYNLDEKYDEIVTRVFDGEIGVGQRARQDNRK